MIDLDRDPQAGIERRIAARHLLQRPLTCKEHDPDVFMLIRRHETHLDRWFTQRLGYRLHVDGDTARLFKSGYVPDMRPLRTHTGRELKQLEYVLLALVLGTTVAGPAVISLRDLVDGIRSAAAEANVDLAGDATERRAIVVVLRWMIANGLAEEMHETVDTYATDEEADAVLRVRPDRITLLPLPAMVGAGDAAEILERSTRREATRQWLRGRLTEDPVVFQEDLTETEWGELRRRLGEEERLADEMFGLVLEARAEGVAAVDPDGSLSEQRFPAGGTQGHAALLLIERLVAAGGRLDEDALVDATTELVGEHSTRWSNEMVEAPHRLARVLADLLCQLRLARWEQEELCLLPAAARFMAVDEPEQQVALW